MILHRPRQRRPFIRPPATPPPDRQRPLPTVFQAFYHIACLPGWQAIFQEQLASFQKCRLQPATFVLGSEQAARAVAMSLPVIGHQDNAGWFETPTLDEAWKWAKANPTGAVLYCHSKGVSRTQDASKTCWRQLLMREVVEKWEVLLPKLTCVDSVGVNLCEYHGYRYYEGNIWLARVDHLCRLPPPWQHRAERRHGWLAGDRMHAEAWLFSVNHVAESLLCSGRHLGDLPTCESLLNPPQPVGPPCDDEIRRLIKHPGATDRLPEPLRSQVQRILRDCGCRFRQNFDPLLPQVRPFFASADGRGHA